MNSLPKPLPNPMPNLLPLRRAAAVFLVLAGGYFVSSLLRGVTATLAPVLMQTFQLSAAQLGLLAGGYFLGFAALQLPLGHWLDRHGPRRVLLAFLSLAVLSCLAFAMARGLYSLLAARVLGGIGVCACLMAPLTGYRHWFGDHLQQRANAWMLMAGALGLLASTLPVQWALPVIGWRWVFVGLAGLFAVAMLGIAWLVPTTVPPSPPPAAQAEPRRSLLASYRPIFAHPVWRRYAPIAFVNYGALLAVQTLWAGPWLVNVAGGSPMQAAAGLFGVNLTMLGVFWLWGIAHPRLARAGIDTRRVLVWGLPFSIACLALMAALGAGAGWPLIALFCATASVLSLSQPAVGMAFPAHEAGRALSALNLLMFGGTFVWQWGIGAAIDCLHAWTGSIDIAYRGAFAGLALCCTISWAVFVRATRR